MAEVLVGLQIQLLSGVVVLERLQVSTKSLVREVKLLIQAQEGTPLVRQQLVHNFVVLPDAASLESLGIVQDTTLGLVRRASLRVVFDCSSLYNPEAPEKSVSSELFQVPGVHGDISLKYFHHGWVDSRLLQDGMCSVFVHHPTNTVIRCRVTLGDTSREALTFNEVRWTNFAPTPAQVPTDLTLEVLHLGPFGRVTHLEDGWTEWDLRATCGGMPFKIGQQVCSVSSDFKGANGCVSLNLVYFPGGHASAPAFHSSIWVTPISGLGDQRYVCIVDGARQLGSGESWLHFPRPEDFGLIRIRLETPDEAVVRRSSLKGAVGTSAPQVVAPEPTERGPVAD